MLENKWKEGYTRDEEYFYGRLTLGNFFIPAGNVLKPCFNLGRNQKKRVELCDKYEY